MLLTKEVEVILNNSIIKYYSNLGYDIPKIKNKYGDYTTPRGTKIIVKVEDLSHGSRVQVDVKCDCCGEIINPYYNNYLRYLRRDGKYYCKKCSKKLFSINTYRKTILRNRKSFEQWCIENNRQDILDRWDYELNDCRPSEITYGTPNKYYFKCLKGLHKSELKNIGSFTSGEDGVMDCKQCISFAQWGIDHLGEDFFEKYWDYDKNVVNPWEISKGNSRKKVYIKCQKKDYHGSYDITPNHFTLNNPRCPYCNKNSGKVHPLDSLGKLLEDKGLLHLWSEKNKRSPYEYPPTTHREVYWKCPEGNHKDYSRDIASSNRYNFRCPECNYSKGEVKISSYYTDIGFIKIEDNNYKILDDVYKEKYSYFIPQKEFDGLIGLKGGNLSYDFYLPNKYNLLI